MKLTSDQLQQLQELGESQFPVADCAVILGVDETALLQEVSSRTETGLAYERGRLLAESVLRKAIFTQAKQGSSPAQKQMTDLIKENRERNLAQLNQSEPYSRQLCIFNNPSELASDHKKHDLTRLFVVVEKFVDSDHEERFKIAPVKKIGADGISFLEKEIIVVYDDAIRIVLG